MAATDCYVSDDYWDDDYTECDVCLVTPPENFGFNPTGIGAVAPAAQRAMDDAAVEYERARRKWGDDLEDILERAFETVEPKQPLAQAPVVRKEVAREVKRQIPKVDGLAIRLAEIERLVVLYEEIQLRADRRRKALLLLLTAP